jgi:hypothetical protein
VARAAIRSYIEQNKKQNATPGGTSRSKSHAGGRDDRAA